MGQRKAAGTPGERHYGEALARQAGLIDSFGRPVRGLPGPVVSGATCDCEAAWRGASWPTAH